MQKHILYILPICLALCTYKVNAQSIYTESGTTLYVTGSAAVDGAVSVSPTIYTEGAIQNGGTLLNSGEIQTKGDFSNTGTLTSTGDEVFIGTANQSVSGNLTGSNAFTHLVVDKTGNPLTLGANAAVSTQANLINGKIVLGTNNLTIAPSANITGYDASDYIMTDGTGTLQRNVAASNVIFPIGNSSYNPVTVNNTGTNDIFSARVSDNVGCSGGNLGITNKVNRTWHLSEAITGGSYATITTQWAAADEDNTFDRSKSGIATDTGTSFDLPAANSAANVVSAGIFSQTQTGQNLISPRIVTSIDSVTIIGNTTFCNGGSVTFQAPTNAAYTYQWYKNNVAITGAMNSSYTATASGNYNVYIAVNGTCIVRTVPISVNVNPSIPAPTIAFSSPSGSGSSRSVCAGATNVIISSSTSNISQYVWYKNGTVDNSFLAPNNTYNINTNAVGTDVYQLAVNYTGNTCLSPLSNSLSVVKTAPNAVITPMGPTAFCLNTPTVLQASTGTNYSYVWKRGTMIVQVGGTSYTPTASGIHTLTVTNNSTGCVKTSPDINIAVYSLPSANAGIDKSACLGESVQIGSTSVAGNTYTWSPSTSLNNVFDPLPTVTPTNTVNYTLTVYNPVTGCSNTDMVLVTRLLGPTTPSLSATAASVCEGASITLTPSNLTGATSVNWYKNGTLLYNKPNNYTEVISATSASANFYTIKSKSANTCLSNISNGKSAWVKVAPIPTISSSPAAIGSLVKVCVPGGTSGNALLTANSTTPSPAYSWKLGASFIPSANTSTYSANVTTTANNKVFSVRATYPNGCVKTSTNTTVQLVTFGCTPAKIDEEKAGDALISLDEISMSAYPNPTQDKLNIEIVNVQQAEGTIFLYNALGQVIKEQKLSFSEGKAEVIFDMKDLSRGIYTLSFQTEQVQKTEMIVKE